MNCNLQNNKLITNMDFRELFLIIASSVFLVPPIIENLAGDTPYVETVLNVVRLFLILVLFVSLLLRKDLKPTLMEIVLLLFAVWGFLVTFVNQPEYLIRYAGSVGFKIVAMILLVKNIANGKTEKIINGIAMYFTALIWINALLMIVFPDGLFMSSEGAVVKRANWIFGSKNNVTLYAIVVLCILLLDNPRSKRTLNNITIGIFIIESACMGPVGVEFLGGSTTALLVLAIFCLTVLFQNTSVLQWIERKIKVRDIALISILLCALIWYVSLNQSGMINIVLNDVLSVFGKSTSFNGRDGVWSTVLQSIMQHPFFGCGFYPARFQLGPGQTGSTYGFWGSIAYYYGVIGVMIFFASLFLCERNNVNCKNKNNQPQFVLKLSIVLLMIYGLANDVYNLYCLLFIMELFNHSESLNFYVERESLVGPRS